MRLDELARVIRSKNAGPYGLTIDVIFADEATRLRAASAASLQPDSIAKLYGVPTGDVVVMEHAASHAIKISIRRPTPAGALEDRDLYGAQQHVPLLSAEIP